MRRRTAAPALVLWAAVAAVSLPAPALAAGGQAGARARAILADPRFQQTAPAAEPAAAPHPLLPRASRSPDEAPGQNLQDAPTPPPGGGRAGLPPLAAAPEPDPDPAADGETDLARAISWGLLAVAAALLATWAVRAWQARRRAAAPSAETAEPFAAPPATAVAAAAAATPAEAERLAAASRYGEAVHLLLLAVIGQIAERSRRQPPPAQTSRELIQLLPLRTEARAAFAGLVRDAERGHFGGVPAGREDYEVNVRRFLAIAGRPAA